jgi:DNA-binding LacI/PurR family transcriptional regulator
MHEAGLEPMPELIRAGKAIRQHNLCILEDVSLAAQDELPWMPLFSPGITVSAQPIYEMGRLAINLLMARIDGDAQPIREVRLAPQLIVRQSVAPPAQVELSPA